MSYREEAKEPKYRFREPTTIQTVYAQFRTYLLDTYGLQCGELITGDDCKWRRGEFSMGPWTGRLGLSWICSVGFVGVSCPGSTTYVDVWSTDEGEYPFEEKDQPVTLRDFIEVQP